MVKQAVINGEYNFFVLISQQFHKAADNPCGKQSGTTLLVGFGVIEETIDCIFAESFLKNPSFFSAWAYFCQRNETE